MGRLTVIALACVASACSADVPAAPYGGYECSLRFPCPSGFACAITGQVSCGKCQPSTDGSGCYATRTPYFDVGCARGLSCTDVAAASPHSSGGVCTRFGSACTVDADCGPLVTVGPFVCDHGTCSRGVGAMCGTFGGGKACSLGSFCNGAYCQANHAVGDACTSDVQCASGMCCLAPDQKGTCGSGSVCQAPAGVGSACNSNIGCDTLWCSASVCAPRLGVGQACNVKDASCAVGLACDPVLLTCQAPHDIPVGGPCSTYAPSDFPCAPNTVCDGVVCTALVAAGAPCSDDLQCPDGYACVQKTARAPDATCQPALQQCVPLAP